MDKKAWIILGVTAAVLITMAVVLTVQDKNKTSSTMTRGPMESVGSVGSTQLTARPGRGMTVRQYFSAVYPKAVKYIKDYWTELDLNFFYACAPVKIAAVFGGIVDGASTGYAPPDLNAAWVPIWFSPGTYAINLYPPQRWWDYVHADGFSDAQWVEMMHGIDDNDFYTVYGYWTYYTKGSGVWYNVGKTLKAKNKLDALRKLGLSRDDIARLIQKTNYMTNAVSEYQTIQSLADSLFSHTAAIYPIQRVEMLVDLASAPQEYTDMYSIEQLYAADRANNSADWDGDIAMLAWGQGYDSVQFTVQANGNGGWAHETVFCGMDSLRKDKEKTWKGWSWMKSRMAIGDPRTEIPLDRCSFDQTTEYSLVTCQEQPISSRAECVDTPPTPYPGQ